MAYGSAANKLGKNGYDCFRPNLDTKRPENLSMVRVQVALDGRATSYAHLHDEQNKFCTRFLYEFLISFHTLDMQKNIFSSIECFLDTHKRANDTTSL